ncbi:oxidoreductase [Amycolatopsis orientalis]|uniref:Oxidoreductase n=1 Tax=Amycolatopsis orientalis TaxID=31958 RepID=A0A193C6V4_AMYOR|nr:NAD-dependent epimerase/dehydratase [Amycolatopsis orientalis]ANN20060.1 oxidoreductase [Amycolatopsis orientalis]
MKTITVLGASGFVGSAVTRALVRQPIRLRAVARGRFTPPSGRAETTVVAVDLTDRAALAEAVAGSDAVVYLLLADGGWRAAETTAAARVNVGVMRDLVEVIGSGGGTPPLVVYSGTSMQVGVPPREPLDGSEPDLPVTAYAMQKLAAEEILKEATANGRVRGISLRLPTVFGENTVEGGKHDSGVVSAMARRAFEGQALPIWGDGTVRRDLVHVDDIAAAFTAALAAPDSLVGAHWLLGAGRGDRLGEVFRLVARETAEHTGRDPVEVIRVEPPAHAPTTDSLNLVVDSTPFRRITGWRPEISLSDGVRRTVAALTSSVEGKVRT